VRDTRGARTVTTVGARPGMPGERTASLIRMLAAGARTTHIRSHQETHPKGR
jgi:hypothetical protein